METPWTIVYTKSQISYFTILLFYYFFLFCYFLFCYLLSRTSLLPTGPFLKRSKRYIKIYWSWMIPYFRHRANPTNAILWFWFFLYKYNLYIVFTKYGFFYIVSTKCLFLPSYRRGWFHTSGITIASQHHTVRPHRPQKRSVAATKLFDTRPQTCLRILMVWQNTFEQTTTDTDN